jgi:regulation of enolase protein 1 (concanavalin A-like superfamily)
MRKKHSSFPIRICISFASCLILLAHVKGQQISVPGIPKPCKWENQPASFSIKGNALTATAGEKTDMFRDPNVTYNTDNAPKLMFEPDEDFVLVASLSHAFSSKWDGAAIVLKQDSLNWIKFCFERDYTGAHRVVSVVTKNISDDCNSVEIPGNQAWFKMAKAGNVVTLYCSSNGKDWLLVRHLQFDAKPGFRVGFLVQSPTGKSCTAMFSDIQYAHRKIKDPYIGDQP